MIYIVSFSNHRIDEMLADMAFIALTSVVPLFGIERGLPITLNPEDKLLVFNGMRDLDSNYQKCLLHFMNLYPEQCYYFIDDHTTYVPNYKVNIISQFKNIHPKRKLNGTYWQISKLASLLSLVMGPLDEVEEKFDFVYWGKYKPERQLGYELYIPNVPSTLIIADKEPYIEAGFDKCTYAPYTRDMQELYKLIASGVDTYIIGDEYHGEDGENSIPWRYYEANYCNVVVQNQFEPKVYTAEEIGKELLELLGINLSASCEPKQEVTALLSSQRNDINNAQNEPTRFFEDSIDTKKSIDYTNIEGQSTEEFKSTVNTQAEHFISCTTQVLEQRASIYGTYIGGVECRAAMIEALNIKYRETHNDEDMPLQLMVMLSDQVLKLMRIVSDPEHLDSYIDNEGYARLIKEAKERGEF